MTTPEQDPLTDEQKRVMIRNMFINDDELREIARDELKKAWCYDQPSFWVEELASNTAETASLMAARRDGAKEVIAWILAL